MKNHLKNETSPYLLQHEDNPVDWYPWGEEAFRKAKEEDKPIFLSIGYSTCHWCHVMAHESFEDKALAGIVNENYVPVKVDREERPDVDSVYMQACTSLNGSGGWPLTVVATPEGAPFFVGTYLPLENRSGRMGLKTLLNALALKWQTEREDLLQSSAEILKWEGAGHTYSIHAEDPELVRRASLAVPASRVMVNTPSALGGIGATTNLFPALTLGCGAVGGSSSSNNIGPLDLINIKRVAWGVRELEELRGGERLWTDKGQCSSELIMTLVQEICRRLQ